MPKPPKNSPPAVLPLIAEVTSGNRRSLARAISLIENEGEGWSELTDALYRKSCEAKVIGITGAPGAGKSTLVDALASHIISLGKRVAVLAIDPSSPFSGGAILGDRIRMSRSGSEAGVFIRSMASRGALGGLAPRSSEVIVALGSAGYDYVLVETVGVGQGEVEIVSACDAVLVVVVPGMGDGVQALKAGILEIADLFVINKADYDGVDRLEKELLGMLSLVPSQSRQPEIVRTVASEAKNIPQLFNTLIGFLAWSNESGTALARKKHFLRLMILKQVQERVFKKIASELEKSAELGAEFEKLTKREIGPSELVSELERRLTSRQLKK